MPIFNTVYGGGGWKREPTADTILYLPFTDDLLDHSGKGVTLTQGGSGLSIVDGVADFSGGFLKKEAGYGLSSLPATISYWVKVRSLSSTGETAMINSHIYSSGSWRGWGISLNSSNGKISFSSLPGNESSYDYTRNKRNYITMVLKSNGVDGYVNAQKLWTVGTAATLMNRLAIGTAGWTSSDLGGNHLLNGQMSQLIIDGKEWLSDDITTYYTKTSSKYS